MTEMISVETPDGEDATLLTMTIKDFIERNLKVEKNRRKVQGAKFSATLHVTDMEVTTTIEFTGNKINIKNGGKQNADVIIETDFETLANVANRTMSPLKAKLKKMVKTKGCIFKISKLLSVILVPIE